MIGFMKSSGRKADVALLMTRCEKINDSARRAFRNDAQYQRTGDSQASFSSTLMLPRVAFE